MIELDTFIKLSGVMPLVDLVITQVISCISICTLILVYRIWNSLDD